MVECPHACTVVVIETPKLLLVFKSFDECVMFLGISLLGGLALPCPLISCFLLFVSQFLGRHFLGRLFLACLLWLDDFGCGATSLTFQRVDLRTHHDDLFLFFSGLVCPKHSLRQGDMPHNCSQHRP